MAPGTFTAMGEDRLLLAQILSPAFPIGAFAYSQGMETAMVGGVLRDAAGVESWVRATLRFGTPRMDAVIAAHARAGADPDMLAALILSFASCAERETELLEQGRAFGALIGHIWAQPVAVLPLPVAVGLATARLNLPTAEVLALFLHGAAAQMVSAATRFLPLGQSESQAILSRLAPLIIALAEECAIAPLDSLASFTPGADMAAMRHETLEVRIFRT